MEESERLSWRRNVFGAGWVEVRDETSFGTTFVLDGQVSKTGRSVFLQVAQDYHAVVIYDGISDRGHFAVAYGKGIFPQDGILVKSSWAKDLSLDFDRMPEEISTADLQTMLDGGNPSNSSLTRWMESMIGGARFDMPFLDC